MITLKGYDISAEIHYDPNRTTGYYFAAVTVHKFEITNLFPADEKVLSTRTLEVILNGPGTSKAEKKIKHHLNVLGYIPKLHTKRSFEITPLAETEK